MESGVASWNKCYKDWRVFSPCSAEISRGRTEAGSHHSVRSARIDSSPAAIKNSGHAIGIEHEVSFNPHTVDSDIAH
jgi:hypothetical protein